MHGAARGTPDAGGFEGGGTDDKRSGRWDERPDKRNKKPAAKGTKDEEKYREATEDEIMFSRVLGKAIGEATKCPAQPHQNTNMLNTRISGFG